MFVFNNKLSSTSIHTVAWFVHLKAGNMLIIKPQIFMNKNYSVYKIV